MRLLKRVGFYLMGVALGSIAVIYFWKNKNVTFDYGMDARTLKSIRTKKLLFSENVQLELAAKKIDTTKISTILKYGDVDFGKSKPRQKPCAEYYVIGKDSLKNIHLYVKRCDSTASIEKVLFNR